MTQLSPVTPPGTRTSPRPNIYTALLLVMCIALLVGVVFIGMRSQALYGNFFQVPQASGANR